MKKILWVLLFIIVVLIFSTSYNRSLNKVISRLSREEFKVPTQLKFRIYLLGLLPVGEAELNLDKRETYQEREVYHLQAEADTLDWFSSIFEASVSMDSWVDIRERYPVLFKQSLAISNKKDKQSEIIYDQKNGIMIIDGVKRKILTGTHDPLSLIFYIMQINLEKIKDLQMNINTNQKNYLFSAAVFPQEKSIGNKKYKIATLKTDIRRRDKNPYHQSKLTVVLLKGKVNLPLIIKVFAGGFLVNARLIDIK